MDKRQRILAHYTKFWKKYDVQPLVEYKDNEIISISFQYKGKNLILPLCWCSQKDCQKCKDTEGHIETLEMKCKFSCDDAKRCYLCFNENLDISFDDRERLSKLRDGDIFSLSLKDKINWYKLYLERSGKKNIVENIVRQTIVCHHREELSQNKEVQDVFMAMFCDCLPLTEEFIVPWLRKHNLPESFCDCERTFYSG
ncbi:hypothetical protein LAU_0444 [Lausannevirus]|uniref:Uncharacterized protein n=2 Tax=Lausannevirus TaxID=999883 RepID=A0A0N9PWP7_9VIRU|nr:hypothetical protein LAU_0444 [Lausannevirus]AEA07294.1 hypothetical protein LAU_0444 [Lausannevirus]ALH07102.1 hypothetical protein PMV_404 [Port-miou virus]